MDQRRNDKSGIIFHVNCRGRCPTSSNPGQGRNTTDRSEASRNPSQSAGPERAVRAEFHRSRYTANSIHAFIQRNARSFSTGDLPAKDNEV